MYLTLITCEIVLFFHIYSLLFLLQHLCTQIILGADPHIDTAGSGVRDGMAGSWAGCSQQGEVMSSLFNKVTSEEGEQSRLC